MKSESAIYTETRSCKNVSGDYEVSPEVICSSMFVDSSFRHFLTRAAKLADSGFEVSLEAGNSEISRIACFIAKKVKGSLTFWVEAECTLVSSYSLQNADGTYRNVTKAEYDADTSSVAKIITEQVTEALANGPSSTFSSGHDTDGRMSRTIELYNATNTYGEDKPTEIHFFVKGHEDDALACLTARLAELTGFGFKMKSYRNRKDYFEGTRGKEKITLYVSTHGANIPAECKSVDVFPSREPGNTLAAWSKIINPDTEADSLKQREDVLNAAINKVNANANLSEREQRVAKAAASGVVSGAKADAKKQGYIDSARGYTTTVAPGIVSNGSPATAKAPAQLPVESRQEAVSSFKPIEDATYTVVSSDGSYRTFRFDTRTEGDLKGKTVISYLSGPDNSTDFQGCAFYDRTNGRVGVWRRYQDNMGNEIQRAVGTIAGNPAEAGLSYAMKSNRCCLCGRKLTVPASLHAGMGPECASKRLF